MSLIAIQNIKQGLFGLLNRHCYIGILEYMYLNNWYNSTKYAVVTSLQ